MLSGAGEGTGKAWKMTDIASEPMCSVVGFYLKSLDITFSLDKCNMIVTFCERVSVCDVECDRVNVKKYVCIISGNQSL